MGKLKVTLKDVAAKAGVSPTTVSLVLNNRPNRVSKENKEKIFRIAKELNYVPNQVARSLATNRTNLIGLIIPNIENPFFAGIAMEIEQQLTRRNYVTVIMNSNDNNETQQHIISKLNGINIDGLIIVHANGFFYENSLIQIQRASYDVPTIHLDRYLEKVETPQVYYDNEKGSYLSTKYLIDLGHRKIGNLGANMTLVNSLHRSNGYLRALREFDILPEEEWYVETKITFEDGYRNADKILGQKELTAVVCANDLVALGFMRRAQELKIRVPEDISVVGYDNIEYNKFSAKPLTSVEQNPDQLALVAIDKLLKEIEGQDSNKEFNNDVVLEPKLIIGETTRAI